MGKKKNTKTITESELRIQEDTFIEFLSCIFPDIQFVIHKIVDKKKTKKK